MMLTVRSADLPMEAAMGYPIGSSKRGLARVTYEAETLPWEFDIRAVPPG